MTQIKNPSRRPIQWRFMLETLGLVFFFAYLFLFSGTNDDFYNLPVVLIGIVLAGLGGLAWLAAGQKAAMPLGRFIFIYGLVFTLASFGSIDPRRSFGEGILFLVAVFLFGGAAELVSRGLRAGTFLQAFMLSGTVVAAIMWVGFGFWYAGWLNAAPGQWIPTITYRLPMPNMSAIYLNVQLFLTAGYLLSSKKWGGRIMLGLNLVSILGLSFLSSARAAWLGAAGGILLVGVLFILANRQKAGEFWKGLLRRRWLLVLAVVSLLAGAVLVGWVLLRQTNYPTHGAPSVARTPYWTPAWDAFLRYPLLGQGPFTYVSVFVTENSLPPGGVYVHGHSVLLNTLAEMGLAGGAALLLLFGAACRGLYRLWKLDLPDNRPQVWAACGMLLAFTINGIFDCFHTEPMGMWSLFIVLGATLAGPPGLKPGWIRGRPWWVVLLVGGALLNYQTMVPLQEGILLADDGQWPAAVEKMNETVRVDPGGAIGWQQLGLAAAGADLANAPNPAAQAAFENTVRLDGNWGANRLNLGALYFAAGDLEKAQAQMDAAVKDAPLAALYHLNRGVVLEAGGSLAGAIAAYQQALELDDSWREAYFWRSSETRRKAALEFKARNPASPPPSLAELEAAVAREYSTALPYLHLAEAYRLAGRLDDAEHTLELAQQGYFALPVEQLELLWQQAALWAAQGKPEPAAGLGFEVIQSYLRKGINGPGADGRMTFYTQWGFRRPAMQIEFVPQVTAIPLPDLWGRRMAQLAGWYEEAANLTQAEAVRQSLLEKIPDFDTLPK